MIPKIARDRRLRHGLTGRADGAGDQECRARYPGRCLFGGQLKDRFEQVHFPDRELGRVHTDRQPDDTGVEIIAAQRALTPFVQRAVGRQRQRMGRYHTAAPEGGQGVARNVPNLHDISGSESN